MNREFKGVWIPSEVYLNGSMSWTEKILLTEIFSLQKEEGCFASNQYLAEFLGIKEKTVANLITKLTSEGHLVIEGYGATRKLFCTVSRNRESEPQESRNRDKVSRNREKVSRNRDSSTIRINNTEINTERESTPQNGVDVFRKYYPNIQLHLYNQDLLTNLTTDLDVFEQALVIWVKNQWREQNIGGMLDLHQKLLAKQKASVVEATDLFCDKCRDNSGWLQDGEGWTRCSH